MAIYLPSFLLIIGVIPFRERPRASLYARNALAGINASVVGLLLAAFYQPVWTSAVFRVTDFVCVLLVLAALTVAKLPPWLVVIVAAAAGLLLDRFTP